MEFNLLDTSPRRKLSDYERIINLPRLLAVCLMVTGLASLVILVGRLVVGVEGNWEVPLSLGTASVFSFVLFLLNRRGYFDLASRGLFLLVISVISYNLILFNGIYDVGIMGFPAVIVFGGMLFGRRSVTKVTLIVCIAFSLIYLSSYLGFTVPFTFLESKFQDFITNLIFFIVFGILLLTIMRAIEEYVSRVIESEERLQKAYESILRGWSGALELRDRETEGHSQRVTELTIKLALRFGFTDEEIKYMRWGALLHDIGKMGLSDDILQKPGSLTDDEFDQIKKHPEIAVKLLGGVPDFQEALLIPRYHHEKFDGTGYPDGLKEKEIPLQARIFAVVDVYDALLSNRPYSPPWPHDRVVEYIREQAGMYFDPIVVTEFLELIQSEVHG
jgi:putative nucleotidyltransferase with HDIG domain